MKINEEAKLTSSEANKISSLIKDIYQRNEEEIEEWQKATKICKTRYVNSTNGYIDILQILKQAIDFTELIGIKTPSSFSEAVAEMENEAKKAAEIVRTHYYCGHIHAMNEAWKGDWLSSPQRHKDERNHAIFSIAEFIKYGHEDRFTTEETAMISSILK